MVALVRFTEGFTLQVGHFHKWIFIILIIYHNLKLILGDQHYDTLSRNCCAGKNNWIDLLIEIKSNPLSAGPRVLPHVANGSYRPSSADSSESGYSGILKESIKEFFYWRSQDIGCVIYQPNILGTSGPRWDQEKWSYTLNINICPGSVLIFYRKNLQLQLSNNRQSASFFCK